MILRTLLGGAVIAMATVTSVDAAPINLRLGIEPPRDAAVIPATCYLYYGPYGPFYYDPDYGYYCAYPDAYYAAPYYGYWGYYGWGYQPYGWFGFHHHFRGSHFRGHRR